MHHKFRLGKTVYFIILFVLVFGVALEMVRSDYMLTISNFNASKGSVEQGVTITELPESTIKNLTKNEFLIIYDKEDSSSIALKQNITDTLGYMKKDVTEVPVESVPNTLDQYKSVMITFEAIERLPNLELIEEYVSRGGKVFFAVRPAIGASLYTIYRKLGMYEVGTFITTKGISLTSTVLIQNDGLRMEDDFLTNSALAVGLEQKSRVHVRSIEGVPLLWDVPYQDGRFMVFNGTMLTEKTNRGLIAGAISFLNDDFLYPILNMKLAYIDGFPAPFPQGYDDEILQTYKRDIPAFYRDIWWPFIQQGATKYNLNYTGAVIEAYNNMTKPPFEEAYQSQRENVIKYGRELLKSGGEIGINGYNHVPLVIKGDEMKNSDLPAWDSEVEMAKSLAEVSQFLKRAFPVYSFVTYVPPGNMLSEEGKNAIENSISSVEIISSSYLGGEEFVVEEPFTYLPRITSGYEYTNENKWGLANSITSVGVFSHVITPGEVLSSNESWAFLSKSYSRMLQDVQAGFPWLRSMTTSAAAEQLETYTNTDVYIEETENSLDVYLSHFKDEFYFLLRTDRSITSIKNATLAKIDDDVYMIKANDITLEIGLDD